MGSDTIPEDSFRAHATFASADAVGYVTVIRAATERTATEPWPKYRGLSSSARPFCGMNSWDRLLLALTVIMLVAALVVWLG